jgi:hypothetical protein
MKTLRAVDHPDEQLTEALSELERRLQLALMEALCVVEAGQSWVWDADNETAGNAEPVLDREELAAAANGFELAAIYLAEMQHLFLTRVARDGAGTDYRGRPVADHLRLVELGFALGMTEQGIHRRMESRQRVVERNRVRAGKLEAIRSSQEWFEHEWGPTSSE